jgi:hypothetical protein
MFAALRRVGNEVLVASYWIGDGAAALLEPASGLFRLLGRGGWRGILWADTIPAVP